MAAGLKIWRTSGFKAQTIDRPMWGNLRGIWIRPDPFFWSPDIPCVSDEWFLIRHRYRYLEDRYTGRYLFRHQNKPTNFRYRKRFLILLVWFWHIIVQKQRHLNVWRAALGLTVSLKPVHEIQNGVQLSITDYTGSEVDSKVLILDSSAWISDSKQAAKPNPSFLFPACAVIKSSQNNPCNSHQRNIRALTSRCRAASYTKVMISFNIFGTHSHRYTGVVCLLNSISDWNDNFVLKSLTDIQLSTLSIVFVRMVEWLTPFFGTLL